MRNSVAKATVALLAVLALSSVVVAQTEGPAPTPNAGFIKEGVPKMPDPPGPAPKHDLTGAWVGPQNSSHDPIPPMTPAGEARFKLNKPRTAAQPWSGNDTYSLVCDPIGLPRILFAAQITARGQMWFEPVPNRMVILYGLQRVWRDVWMDGRQLPAKVDARGFPDSRFYGYSVGHWDGDYTFVIDTTGLDDRTWLDEGGHPHSTDAHVQERYTRVDQYNIQLTVTVDDPKFYTKPWQLLRANYYWMQKQDFEETFCVPSEVLAYRDKIVNPSGNQAGVK